MAKKIAFCFCCINSINNVRLWNKFFADHHELYNIYIHAADPQSVTQDFVKNHLIQNYYTTWGDWYLAVMALYRRAMDDGNFKFVLLSGSCIPVKSFRSVYNYLTKDDSSYLAFQPHLAENEFHRATLHSSLKRFLNNSQRNPFYSEIDIKHWFYNETWVILNALMLIWFLNINGYLINSDPCSALHT